MKSYSDINQSKKLAEILPLESADMFFQLGEDKYADSIRVPLTKKHWKQMMPDINPCWSLAALLDVLSKTAYFIDEDGSVDLYDYKNIEWGVCLSNTDSGLFYAGNPVDACVKLIEKLHEQNLL